MAKIKKFQEGGSASPFMVYTPQAGGGTQPVVQQSTQQEATNAESPFSKDMIKLMMNEALPSDLEYFFKQVDSFSGGVMGANGIEGLMGTPQGFNIVIQQLSKMKYNKKKYEGIETELYKNGGLDEPAITNNGYLIARTEDGSETEISLTEYKENKDKYRLLTNNEYLAIRAYDVRKGFDSHALSTLQNGTGFKSITTKIQEVMDKLKYQELSRDEYLSEEGRAALRGLNILLENGGKGKGPDGKDLTPEQMEHISQQIQKGEETAASLGVIKSSTKTREGDLQSAYKYIMASLTDTEKTLIAVKALQNGEDLQSGIGNVISYYMKASYGGLYSQTYTGGTGAKGDGANGGPDTSHKQYDFLYMLNNNLSRREEGIFQLGGSNAMKTSGYMFDSPKTRTGEAKGVGSQASEVLTDCFGGAVNQSEIYIGGQRVRPDMLENMMYTGEPGAVIRLPFKIDDTGRKVPDVEMVKRKDEVDLAINSGNITDPEIIAKMYANAELTEFLKHQDAMDPNKFADFVQLPVYAPGFIVDQYSREWMTEMDKAAEKNLRPMLKSLKNNEKLMSGREDVYKTSIFVSYNRDIAQMGVNTQAIGVHSSNYFAANEAQQNARDQYKRDNATTKIADMENYKQ